MKKYKCTMCFTNIKVTPSRVSRSKNKFCSDQCYKRHKSLFPTKHSKNREQNLSHLLRCTGLYVDFKHKKITLDPDEFTNMRVNGVDPRMTVLQWDYGYRVFLR